MFFDWDSCDFNGCMNDCILLFSDDEREREGGEREREEGRGEGGGEREGGGVEGREGERERS